MRSPTALKFYEMMFLSCSRVASLSTDLWCLRKIENGPSAQLDIARRVKGREAEKYWSSLSVQVERKRKPSCQLENVVTVSRALASAVLRGPATTVKAFFVDADILNQVRRNRPEIHRIE